MSQIFLLTWASLYAALLFIYFCLGAALALLERTKFARARRIQGNPRNGKGPSVAEQRRHAVLSLAAIATLLATGVSLNQHGYALFPAMEVTWVTTTVGAVVSMALYDTYFYWMHRWLHTPLLFRRIHGYHHRVRTPHPWTTNSETVTDGLMINGYWLIAPLLLPIPVEVLIVHRLWDMSMGVVGHCGHEYGGFFVLPPSPLVSVTHHDQHHRHAHCNYAVHFTFWDRLMGTLYKDHDTQVRLKALSGPSPQR